MTDPSLCCRSRQIATIIAIIFGGLTIFSGGRSLSGSDEPHAAVGHAVPFALWFSFLAGFSNIAAGIGILQKYRQVVWIALGILTATAFVFVAFGDDVLMGGAYEIRIFFALILCMGVSSAVGGLRQIPPSLPTLDKMETYEACKRLRTHGCTAAPDHGSLYLWRPLGKLK